MIAARQPGGFFPIDQRFSETTAFFRKARLMIPYGFVASGHQIPQKFPGALRAPDGFISLWFCLFWTPNTPKIPRRASRAGFPLYSLCMYVVVDI